MAPVGPVASNTTGSLGTLSEGAVTSTVQLRLAGAASVLPAVSGALTWKVCAPSVRLEYPLGTTQAPKGLPSREHSKLELASEEEKSKLADVLFTGPDGPESMA